MLIYTNNILYNLYTMEALQQHIQSYGNSVSGIDAFRANADRDFFDNWSKGVESANKAVELGGKLSEGVGLSIEGTKTLKRLGQAAYNKIKGNQGGDDDAEGSGDAEGDSATGADDSGAGNGGGQGTRTGADDDGTGDLEWDDDPSVGFGSEPVGVGGQEASAEQLTRFRTGNLAQDAAETDGAPATASTTGAESASDATSGGADATGSQAGSGVSEGASAEGPTLEGAPESAIEATAGDTAGDVGAGIASTAADAASSAASAIGSGISTAAEAAAPILDVLGPLGLFAGIGLSLYEAFHHDPKPPPAPKVVGATTKAEVVLPTYDSVQDTPASYSAF